MNEKSGELKELFTYGHDASRLECFIRIVYSIAIGAVLLGYGIITGIVMFIQWFVILIRGERIEGFNDFIKRYLEYVVNVMGYICWMTDERPGIRPKAVEIYEKR